MEKPKRNMNPKIEKGDRIICIKMADDPNPVSSFSKGTVTGVVKDPMSDNGEIINMSWDNGSTLSLLSDVDMWIKEPKI